MTAVPLDLAPAAPAALLRAAAARLLAAADALDGGAREDVVGVVLRGGDEVAAAATRLVDELLAAGPFERTSGLAVGDLLRLEGRRTGTDARMLQAAAVTLRRLPVAARLFALGVLSWGQVRVIVAAAKHLDASGCAALDDVIGVEAPRAAADDPDWLLGVVDDTVGRLRADLASEREERAVDGGFLALQPGLFGRGVLYGEADNETLAGIAEAVEAAAPRVSDDGGAEDGAHDADTGGGGLVRRGGRGGARGGGRGWPGSCACARRGSPAAVTALRPLARSRGCTRRSIWESSPGSRRGRPRGMRRCAAVWPARSCGGSSGGGG